MRSMMHSSSMSSSASAEKEVLLPAPQKQQLSAFPISAGQRRSGPSLARRGGPAAPTWRGLYEGKRETEKETKLSNERGEKKILSSLSSFFTFPFFSGGRQKADCLQFRPPGMSFVRAAAPGAPTGGKRDTGPVLLSSKTKKERWKAFIVSLVFDPARDGRGSGGGQRLVRDLSLHSPALLLSLTPPETLPLSPPQNRPRDPSGTGRSAPHLHRRRRHRLRPRRRPAPRKAPAPRGRGRDLVGGVAGGGRDGRRPRSPVRRRGGRERPAGGVDPERQRQRQQWRRRRR